MKKPYIIIVSVLFVVLLTAVIVTRPIIVPTTNKISTPSRIPKNFAECVAAGHPVMETNPRRCAVPNGRTYTEELPNVPPTSVTPPETSINDLIQVEIPKPQEMVTSPLRVSGEARGTWFFEASFPVTLKDANGKVLVQTHAQAEGDWMTENFVPFFVSFNFPKPETDRGVLILEKDNPSGLPEHDRKIEIPVKFDID